MGRFKNIVAVASGKGGVGKSTVTASLGLAAAKAGLNVGIIDTDLHGFSIPRMLGESEIPHYTVVDKRWIYRAGKGEALGLPWFIKKTSRGLQRQVGCRFCRTYWPAEPRLSREGGLPRALGW